jgi:hypothetical protein
VAIKQATPLRPLVRTANAVLLEPLRGVREHGIDLPRLRGEIALRQRAIRIFAADFGEQPLELLYVAVDRFAERAIGAIAPADFLERFLALCGVEPAAEDVPFAAPVAIPEIDNGIMVEQARNIERQRVDRVDRAVRRLTIVLLSRCRFLTLFARRAREEIG